jgi:hypothetical protein
VNGGKGKKFRPVPELAKLSRKSYGKTGTQGKDPMQFALLDREKKKKKSRNV